MRIAVVHPYPLHGRSVGGSVRVRALARHLAARHRVFVLTHGSGDADLDRAAEAELGELGIVQRCIPLPRAGAWAKLRRAADPLPYFVHANRNPALEAELARLAADPGLDAVHVEFAYLAPLLEAAGPAPLRSLAEQETMSLAVERLARVPFADRRLYEHWIRLELPRVRRFEARALPGFDLVFAISQVERRRMQEAGGRDVGLLPHLVCARRFRPPAAEPEAESLLFVGNFGHRPNLDGLAWLREQVWPRVRARRPSARLRVAGPGLPERAARALRAAGGEPLGFVPDLPACYHEARVFVNPIHSGGGMRGKVLEAMACGRAVVSTRTGMEGVDATPGEHFLEADQPEAFAAAAERLLSDEALRMRLGRAARARVEGTYDAPAVLAHFEEALAEALRARSGEPVDPDAAGRREASARVGIR